MENTKYVSSPLVAYGIADATPSLPAPRRRLPAFLVGAAVGALFVSLAAEAQHYMPQGYGGNTTIVITPESDAVLQHEAAMLLRSQRKGMFDDYGVNMDKIFRRGEYAPNYGGNDDDDDE